MNLIYIIESRREAPYESGQSFAERSSDGVREVVELFPDLLRRARDGQVRGELVTVDLKMTLKVYIHIVAATHTIN